MLEGYGTFAAAKVGHCHTLTCRGKLVNQERVKTKQRKNESHINQTDKTTSHYHNYECQPHQQHRENQEVCGVVPSVWRMLEETDMVHYAYYGLFCG